MNELRATEELGREIAVEHSPGLVVEGVTQRLRRRIPRHHHRMPRTVLDVRQRDRRGSKGTVSTHETGVIINDIGGRLTGISRAVGIGVELNRQAVADPRRP